GRCAGAGLGGGGAGGGGGRGERGPGGEGWGSGGRPGTEREGESARWLRPRLTLALPTHPPMHEQRLVNDQLLPDERAVETGGIRIVRRRCLLRRRHVLLRVDR